MTPILHDDELAEAPLEQLRAWMAEADPAGRVGEVTASLATVDEHQHPDVRIVVIRTVDDDGLTIYSDTRSRKGQDLEQNPRAAILMYWPELRRQVRLRGPVEILPDDANDAAFSSRPRPIGYWANHQSAPISDRQALVAQAAAVERQLAEADEIARPDHWVVYRLVPGTVEFWQAAEDHLHDRIEYRRSAGGWETVRLQP
ncbi:pyridoxamine 5'-phosphate oxidase [Georgenia sp. 10Sc9-8]|uniref:Pyridoxamine 5'-phosphate oxidase n=1 Tax=Georgenia halotolerans TaxID=3028317 RepID=A0ABT5TT81_9MICO|nr:pyridoxamine 5'-phosphate oxidase [Georgenia halotolerans]